MPKQFSYLGIYDWGIGGLGLYRAFKAQHPNVPVFYFSDAGFTPYGKVPELELKSRVQLVLNWLAAQNATQIAVACNAASSVLPIDCDAKYTGIIEHGVATVLASNSTQVGVIGGVRTVESNVYNNALTKHQIQVTQAVAQPLSHLIEQGDLDSEQLHETAKNILAPLHSQESILMACTHYPAIQHVLQSYLKPSSTLLDPVPTLLAWMQNNWELTVQPNAKDVFITTGNPKKMQETAKHVFGVEIAVIEKLVLFCNGGKIR